MCKYFKTTTAIATNFVDLSKHYLCTGSVKILENLLPVKSRPLCSKENEVFLHWKKDNGVI